MAKIGKVFLIGAGPGDPGLMTRKGHEILRMCDVVIYDALVNPEILKSVKSSALKIFAGKRGTSHGSRAKTGTQIQNRINRLLVSHARKGRTVARLKGGDPFLFGRGGEEAEILARAGVPFEVVPGVSSVSAVPAYAGIPVTDRRTNSMLTIVTGHSGEDHYRGPAVDWRRISPAGTLVILMGVSRIKFILRKLIANGWKKSTPIACIRWGTLPQQEVVTATIGTALAQLARTGFFSPAVIVVGKVVNMREKIAWFRPAGTSG